MFSYQTGTTLLHRIQAAPKIMGLIILSFGYYQLQGVETAILLLLMTLLSRIMKIRTKLLSKTTIILALLLAMAPFWAKRVLNYPVLNQGLDNVCTFLQLLLWGQWLVKTTSPEDMQKGVIQLLWFLPAVIKTRISTLISLSIRAIPLLEQEYRKQREGALLRGYKASPFSMIRYSLAPLMIRTFVLADHLGDAFLTRSYSDHRTLNEAPWAGRDILFLFFSFVLSLMGLSIHTYFIPI